MDDPLDPLDIDDLDNLRFLFANPQCFVFQLCRAQIQADFNTLQQLLGQIDRGGAWRMVGIIAVAELTHELVEQRGAEAAIEWLEDRLQIGLIDPGPSHE